MARAPVEGVAGLAGEEEDLSGSVDATMLPPG